MGRSKDGLQACPVCASAVVVVSGDEGTSHYEAVGFTQERIEVALREAWEAGYRKSQSALDAVIAKTLTHPVVAAQKRASAEPK